MSQLVTGFVTGIFSRIWDILAKRTPCICEFKDNLSSLRDEMNSLKALRNDVKREVDNQEQEYKKRTDQVDLWLQTVTLLETQVDEILEMGRVELEYNFVGSCCPMNCWSACSLASRATKQLEAVTLHASKGHFDVVAVMLPHAEVDERPLGTVVGFDSLFERVWSCLDDLTVGSVGLWGYGGVGKTTLMTKVNNELGRRSHGFDKVLWVVVSKDGNVEKVQDAIHKGLGLLGSKGKSEKVVEILNVLREERFLIFLDDLWSPINLTKLGIPLLNNGSKSKVIFTTRSEKLCHEMMASRKIEVKCLKEKESFELFRQNVGVETLSSHPLIGECAENVARECGGLPLALIVIGCAMAGKRTLQEWENALQVLKDFPSKLSEGIEVNLYRTLKFSYDSLSSDCIKSCFLYCTLFPEDSNIEIDDLVKHWIGEGFLDEFGKKAYDQGHVIIENLKHVCLLEIGDRSRSIKMHDVLRDMALWIACECGQKENKYFVKLYCENEVVDFDNFSNLTETERASLWYGWNIKFTKVLEFSNLTTIFIKDNLSPTHPRKLLQCMPAIKVLNLSGGAELCEVSGEIHNLVSLQYLNLSWTAITNLPTNFKKLKRLRYLGLDGLINFIVKPQHLSNISTLQVMDMWQCGTNVRVVEAEELAKLKILENMENLISAKLTIKTAISLKMFQTNCPKLQSITRGIYLYECSGWISSPFMNGVDRLEHLQIWGCLDLKELRFDISKYLHTVTIRRCSSLKHLNCLLGASSLQSLEIRECNSLEEVIGVGGNSLQDSSNSIFSQLHTLKLEELAELRSICNHPLSFPCLKSVTIKSCPMLKKLPLDSNSANSSLVGITGAPNWWNSLQWEDEATKRIFDPYFHDIFRDLAADLNIRELPESITKYWRWKNEDRPRSIPFEVEWPS